jgi:spermidine synthase
MGLRFEELDWQATPIGGISLRRRIEPTLQVEVHEVLLGEEYLMSSLFTVAEEELARLGLAAADGDDLAVVVGGLGLGWTARTALADPRVASLQVVEALKAVIDWHERDLLPHAAELTGDPRTTLVQGDFFALTASGELPFCDVVLLDVDHSPRHVLHPSHAPFYEVAGLRRLAERLHPGGVFALWSDDPPDEEFGRVLAQVFPHAEAHRVSFANPLTGGESANTVYVARRGADDGPGRGTTTP